MGIVISTFFKQRNIFYGWVIVFVCFVSIFSVFGVRLSFGVFFDALTRDTQFNWSRAQTASVFSTVMIIFALTSTPAGWALDRFGPRRVFTVGALLVGTGLIMVSRMNSLAEFILYYGIWTGLGITILGLSIQAATISRWFDRLGRRGLAIGLAFSGTGVGILLMAPLVERLIAFYDWRMAFLALAAIMLFFNLPVLLLLMRNHPREVGLYPDGAEHLLTPKHSAPSLSQTKTISDSSRNPTSTAEEKSWTFAQAFRTRLFWIIMLAGACSLFTLRMITVHQVAHLVDQGFSRFTAATVTGSTGLITAGAFIIFGQLSDRIGRGRAFYIGAVAQLIALFILINLNAEMLNITLYVYALFWGIGEGSRSGLLTAIASDTFPGSAQGTIIGALGAFFGVGSAIGSWLGGFVFDQVGQYDVAFWTAFTCTIVATLSIYYVERLTIPTAPSSLHRPLE
ncbi:MAG: MFS transporter [Chloroflexota bacterium]